MKLRRFLESVASAGLCYGEPVQVDATKVIPVARIRAAGGGGFGSEKKSQDTGGGGGGFLDAQPVGFIHVGAEGARFEAIPDPERVAKTVATVAKGVAAVIATARLLGR